MRLHDMQKGEKHDLKKNLEIDLKLLQKLQVRQFSNRTFSKCNIKHERMRQVQEINKHEESALEKKVSLRLGLLLQV